MIYNSLCREGTLFFFPSFSFNFWFICLHGWISYWSVVRGITQAIFVLVNIVVVKKISLRGSVNSIYIIIDSIICSCKIPSQKQNKKVNIKQEEKNSFVYSFLTQISVFFVFLSFGMENIFFPHQLTTSTLANYPR